MGRQVWAALLAAGLMLALPACGTAASQAPPPEAEDGDLREHMSKEEWKLLRAVYCEGYSIAEAARLCGMSFEACRKRLYRCKKRLRQELAAQEKGGSVHVR